MLMKKFTASLLLCMATIMSAHAQFNVNTTTEAATPVATSAEPVATQSAIDIEYQTAAKLKAERKAARKERNYFEIGGKIQGILNAYNKTRTDLKGGENNISLSASLNIKHIYKKNLFTLDSKFDAGYGQVYQASDKWFKNNDFFKLTVNPSWDFGKEGPRKNWAYSASIVFNSQFDKGYANRTEAKNGNLKSSFLSPADLTVGVGVKFTSPEKKFPIKINIDPLSCQTKFVLNPELRSCSIDSLGNVSPIKNPYGMLFDKNKEKKPGLSHYKSSRFEGGSSISISLDVYFDKKNIVRYRTDMSSFYGWITDITRKSQYEGTEPYKHIIPTFKWNNTFDIALIKYLTLQLKCDLYYDRQEVDALQISYFTSIGLSYTFRNK